MPSMPSYQYYPQPQQVVQPVQQPQQVAVKRPDTFTKKSTECICDSCQCTPVCSCVSVSTIPQAPPMTLEIQILELRQIVLELNQRISLLESRK